ncbi:hypothetical protein GQ44DRAFT_688216 [Phaeosphaeriaceae sp. PMI808]|nr:hypothetical protein GQ44DRAFT_688216 [Phaeosphaeriaceae sp. PMI808]
MEVKKKHEIEAALAMEAQAISAGQLKEENPLDLSEHFKAFCEACRRGDLKVCQEKISEGVNINARDKFDYTPLILASLCGHYEVIRLLLENGALCERDTFQGERCLYNALNDRIRNLLLSYDYAKSTNPLQPLAAHITSLLTRIFPKTTDITITTYSQSFYLHKFLLAARSPYFAQKLAAAPSTSTWKLPDTIPAESLGVALQYVYFQEVSIRRALFGLSDEQELTVLNGIDKIGEKLQIERLFEDITEVSNRRLLRQRRSEELERGRDQLNNWFRENVLKYKTVLDTDKVDKLQWDWDNSIFADILLRADHHEEQETEGSGSDQTEWSPGPSEASTPPIRNSTGALLGIPRGSMRSRSPSRQRRPKRSTIYPAHRAMLLRSEYFLTMFSSQFKEAQDTPHLQIVTLDCSPAVLETILTFMYTERADFGLDIAIDVLFAADELFIEKLKQRAAIIISALGNGSTSAVEPDNPRGETDADEAVDIYEIIRAGWDTRVQRLEEFAARYIAYRLENYIDQPEFAELVQESANRVKERQETDTVELVDDIRYYLSERFRLRFEDSGLGEMLDENAAPEASKADLVDTMGDLALEDGIKATLQNEGLQAQIEQQLSTGVIRNLDGEEVGDEFAQDAMNYQILLGKIDILLDRLNLDA